MVRGPSPPTSAEMHVLKIVSELGSCAARDVVARAEDEHGWSTSTVKTLLRRLVDKGHLRTRRVGNSFLYELRRSPLQSIRHAADSLLDHAAEGTVGPLLAYLVQKSRLSDSELSELRGLLDEKSPRRNGEDPS